MPKPPIYKCKMYCTDYPCTRKNCRRSILFIQGIKTIMAEPKDVKLVRDQEKNRAYRESRNVRLNF